MINLIPPDYKQSITYARRNSQLISLMIGILIILCGAIVITGGSLFYLRQNTSTIQRSISESKGRLTAQNETEVLGRSKEVSDNLKLAVDVLSNEVLFSQLLNKIGEVMPPGTVLEGITLTNEVFGIGIDLEIGARNYETGSRAYVNLNDTSNGIFEKADLITITCDTEGRGNAYPCVAAIRALFAKDNPFLLVGGAQR